MEITELPILGICGASGSGKTTLIEQTIPLLRGRGLKVAVAKQSPKQLNIDRSGKDSARFFAAGADVLIMGPGGTFSRRQPGAAADFSTELLNMAGHYDLILVEGYQHTPGHKVWLLGDESALPPSEGQHLAALGRGHERPTAMAAIVDDFLARQWVRPPVLGCILIGGKSTRMGRPKHLLIKDGETWLQRTAASLAAVCQQVVVVGQGEVRDCTLPRLPDVFGCEGPLAGLLAVMRWQPWATVLACACDLPDMKIEALHWLLQKRQPGAWAVLPKVGNYHEPLLALYDFRIRPTIEAMASQGGRRLSDLAYAEGVRVVRPPSGLHGAWRNVNYPEMV